MVVLVVSAGSADSEEDNSEQDNGSAEDGEEEDLISDDDMRAVYNSWTDIRLQNELTSLNVEGKGKRGLRKLGRIELLLQWHEEHD
jgi:hypothetical protein